MNYILDMHMNIFIEQEMNVNTYNNFEFHIK